VEGPETANLTFSASSTDASYNNLAIAPVPVAVTDNDQGTSVAVNSGGSSVSAGGVAYLADQYFSGGLTYQVTSAIGNTVNDALYQSERYGTFSYALPVVNGSYS
jgi:hypothetical protein